MITLSNIQFPFSWPKIYDGAENFNKIACQLKTEKYIYHFGHFYYYYYHNLLSFAYYNLIHVYVWHGNELLKYSDAFSGE